MSGGVAAAAIRARSPGARAPTTRAIVAILLASTAGLPPTLISECGSRRSVRRIAKATGGAGDPAEPAGDGGVANLTIAAPTATSRAMPRTMASTIMIASRVARLLRCQSGASRRTARALLCRASRGNGRGENVAAVTDRLDQCRLFGISLDLAPQPADQDIDAAIEKIGGATAREVEELLAAENALRTLGERQEDLEFPPAQRDHCAFRRKELPPPRVGPPAVEFEQPALRASHARIRRSGAAQHGANARQQLARTGRLWQVVVGAHFQPEDAIGFLAQRGLDDDRHAVFAPQLLADGQAVFAGEHQVENYQVEAGALEQASHGPPVVGDRDAVPMLGEELRQERAGFRVVVVDDKQVRRRVHSNRCSLGAVCSTVRSRIAEYARAPTAENCNPP